MHGAATRLRGGGLQATLLAAVLIAGLTSCDTAEDNGGSGGNPDLSAPPESNGMTSGEGEREAIVAAYDEFWVRMHGVPHEPESTWDDAMDSVAVDPQLKITLQGMRLAKERGVTSYGEVTSRISDVDIDGDEATVVDCQDASESGQADAESGEKKNVGVERNPVEALMHRDGSRWKVAEITYPGGEC